MPENKSIMIDGVDVSGCIFYKANFEEDFDVKIKHFCSNWHNSCESINNSSCYYKQLTHKTQECEELKGRLKYIREENKYLKESATDKQIDFVALNNHIKALEFQLNQLKASKEQAEQKLERIRQVLKNGVKIHDDIIVNKSILQIIDEVNDEIKRLKA